MAPVLARNRGYDGVMLPPVADSHEMPAARPMDHAAVAHRGVKASASTRCGASAPVALLISQNLLIVGRAAGFLTGLVRSTAATRRRIGCRVALLSGRVALLSGRIALLSECERGCSKRYSDCDAQGFQAAHVIYLRLSRRSYNADTRAEFPKVSFSGFHPA